MMAGSFVDLRLNSRAHRTDDAFWPSFTDIMTVVVMIFMISMLVLLLKNMDLVHRLQATLEAERTATEKAQNATSMSKDLKLQIQRTQRQLDMLRMQLMDMGEERDRLASELTAANASLMAAASQKKALAGQLTGTETRLAEIQKQYAALESEFGKKRKELAEFRARDIETAKRFTLLEGEYTNLKLKYDKLIRPARSARGKYVVKVRFNRRSGALRIGLQTPGQTKFAQVDSSQLHKTLDKIHRRHLKDLYVRIIFPDNNGLSYSEAWKLTESLLRKYDYYYQNP